MATLEVSMGGSARYGKANKAESAREICKEQLTVIASNPLQQTPTSAHTGQVWQLSTALQ